MLVDNKLNIGNDGLNSGSYAVNIGQDILKLTWSYLVFNRLSWVTNLVKGVTTVREL